MKVITVIGESDSGKTTLLNYFFKRLESDGADVISPRREGRSGEDIVSLFYWQGKKIAICSIGDDATKDGEKDKLKYVKYGTELATKENVDVLINALNTGIPYCDLKNLLNGETFLPPINMVKHKDDSDAQIRQKQNKCQEIFDILYKI